MADLNQQEVQQLMQSFAQLSNSFQHGQRGVGDYADAQRQAANEIQSSFNNAAQQIRGSAIDYTKAMFSATEGTSKYAGAVSAAGNAAWEVGKNFGVLGIAAGGLIKIFGDVAAASLKQNDALTKAYRDFADAGDLSGSLDTVIANLNKVGLTSESADQFKKVLDSVSPSLVLFGGGVTSGLKKYVNVIQGMIQPGEQYEAQAQKLGLDLQGLRMGVAGYMNIQAKLGNSQNMTTAQIQEGSMKYMTTLKELQELTGVSRDEAAKVIEQQMYEYRWAKYVSDLKKQDLINNTNEAEKANEFMAAGIIKYGKTFGVGATEFIINGGKVVGEASAQVVQMTRNTIGPSFSGFIKGTKTLNESFGEIQKGAEENLEIHKNSINALGTGMDGVVGDNDYKMRVLGLTGIKAANAAQTVEDKKREYDKRQAELLEMEQESRRMAIAKDRALFSAGEGVLKVFGGLNTVLYQFSKMLAKMIDQFGPYIGLGKTNLSEGFKDNSDRINDLTILKTEKSKLEADIDRLKNGTEVSSADKEFAKQVIEGVLKANQDKIDTKQAEIRKVAGDNSLSAEEKAKQKQKLENELANLNNDKAITKKKEEQIKNGDVNVIREATSIKRQAEIQKKEAELLKKQEEISKTRGEIGSVINKNDIDKASIAPKGRATSWNTDYTGAPANELVTAQRASAQGGIRRSGAEIKTDKSDSAAAILKKLNFGSDAQKKERTSGEVDPKLLALADRLSSAFPGGTFTALNDDYHRTKKPGSKHAKGLALDYALAKPPSDAEEAAAIKERLKDLGATTVLDEYFSDSAAGDNPENKGGHFHLEVARQGGLFSGPEDGFPVMLHGKKESVWNEKQMHALLEDVKKSSVDDYKQELMDQMGLNKTAPTPAIASGSNDVVMNMISLLSDKFDTLISISNQTKNIHDEILTYTRS